MELKDYQRVTLYAWEQVNPNKAYASRKNGIGQPLPSVSLKVPTGGGKTFIAVKALDLIQNIYRGSQTGLVLWIVPTTQIYNQTYTAFRDRAHPYRQALDMASAGSTLILEKDQLFAPEDIASNLVVLMLMLPSANRRDKETLKIFQDRGGFEAFFPAEDQYEKHAGLKERVTNLDAYDASAGFDGIVKSSLGNTLRLLNPIIILDEGHKAYSQGAQETLHGFNPSLILELSATPLRESNVLVSISGRDVWQQGMIKLPVRVNSRVSADGRDALLASHLKRVELEEIAKDYQNRTGIYVRPICLIQVERTGEKQRRLPGFIHAEDARDYLITKCNVLPEEIAIKSSERDDIENIDLLSPDCPIRYIITRQALQEGWDCAFAYVLTTLINSDAPTSMTQLVGRILRQPYARKTTISELNESFVFFSRNRTGKVLDRVYASLHDEGLDDVPGSVTYQEGHLNAPMQEISIRPAFAQYAGKVYLPCFVLRDTKGRLREIGHEMDILSRIRWEKIDLGLFDEFSLNPTETGDTVVALGLDGFESPLRVTTSVDMKLDLAFITRQMLDVVNNPWVAYEIVGDVVRRLRQRYPDERIRRDIGFVITELKKVLIQGRDAQAEKIFRQLLDTKQLNLWLIAGCAGNAIPDRIRAHSGRKFRNPNTDDLPKRSLFDYVADDFNDDEAAVALYLDEQDWVMWWCRSTVPQGYSVQGWLPNRVYPDFYFQKGSEPFATVQVLEMKGKFLKNEDTHYKQSLFALANQYGHPRLWDEIAQEFANHKVKFEVVFDDEWQRVINAMATNGSE